MIDLRSDTVTRPTEGMLKAMMQAEVGDDVLGDDPTVNRLQDVAAEFLGQEAALFLPSGTMANTVACKTWTQPADEVILDRTSHTYSLESGAGAAFCGLSYYPVDTPDGILAPDQVEAAIRTDALHHPATRLVVLENTHNRAGGTAYTVERVRELREVTRKHGLILHMDGARLANAAVARRVKAADYGRLCDSVTQCLSKSLGCPVGTVLAGPVDFIARTRRYRKMLGGGMRQAGYLAAAGIYALENNIERLAEDHANARRLADGIAQVEGLEIDQPNVTTNIVYFRFKRGPEKARQVFEGLKADGVLMLTSGPNRVRAVTHLGITAGDIDRAVELLEQRMRDT